MIATPTPVPRCAAARDAPILPVAQASRANRVTFPALRRASRARRRVLRSHSSRRNALFLSMTARRTTRLPVGRQSADDVLAAWRGHRAPAIYVKRAARGQTSRASRAEAEVWRA